MIKVIHVGYTHMYNDMRILKKECKALKSSGLYDVTYITSDKHGTTFEESFDGIKIKIIELKKKRGISFFFYLRQLKKMICELDAEIYHIHESILLLIIPFLKRRGKMVIYDMHEDSENDWADYFKKYGKFVAGIVKKTVSYYEKKMIKKSDGFIYVTPQFAKQGDNNTPEALIPNFPIISYNDMKSYSYESYIARENSICFAGGISSTWCQCEIIKAIEELPIRYNLAGRTTGAFLDKMESLNGWRKVKFYGQISFDEVKEIYSKSKIGIALLDYIFEDDKTGTLGNTKIYEFMQAGLPIICTDFVIWKKIIDKYNCGIYINPIDDRNIKNAIMYLLEHPKEAYLMGQNGQRAINEEYNWENYVEVLLELYGKVRRKLEHECN